MDRFAQASPPDPLLRQRSPEGQVRFLQWRGVRNYLRDFSQLADAPVGHLLLWERYLVGPESGPDAANWRTELNKPLVA